MIAATKTMLSYFIIMKVGIVRVCSVKVIGSLKVQKYHLVLTMVWNFLSGEKQDLTQRVTGGWL